MSTGIIKRATDVFYTYRFLRILTTPWKDMDAYKHGIVDADGKVLRKSRQLINPQEKESYTLFHRLVFNVKRMLEKLPLGKSRIASYAAALLLLKENYGISDEQIKSVLMEVRGEVDASVDAAFFINESTDAISPGIYVLSAPIVSPLSGDEIGKSGDKVEIKEGSGIVDTVLGVELYEAKHVASGSMIYVSGLNISR